MPLIFLKNTGQVFCRIFLTLGLFWYMMIRLRLWSNRNYGCLFGKNTTEVICPSHHTISEGTWCLHDITDDADLEHLNKVVFDKFLHFHALFFASDSLNPANPGWLGMRGESFYVYYMRRFVSYPLIYEIYIKKIIIRALEVQCFWSETKSSTLRQEYQKENKK